MSENFVVEIISPDKSILKSEATEVTIPSYEGEMGILKDHIPLITFLRPGMIVIKKDSKEKKFFITVGLAYSIQEEKKIPREKHDMRLDYIITEKEILSNINQK